MLILNLMEVSVWVVCGGKSFLSQNHRMAVMGGELQRSSNPICPLTQGLLNLVAQDHTQKDFEYHQRWWFHTDLWQPVQSLSQWFSCDEQQKNYVPKWVQFWYYTSFYLFTLVIYQLTGKQHLWQCNYFYAYWKTWIWLPCMQKKTQGKNAELRSSNGTREW